MTNSPTLNRPSHRAYSVEKYGEGKSYWTDIGAA